MSMKRFVKKSSRELAIVGLILAMTVIFTLIQPRFMQSSTFIDIIEQATINSFLGIGMTLAIITGGIDLSVGSIMAVVVCVCRMASVGGMNKFAVILLGLAVGAVIGFLNGFLIAKMKLQPFVATLGTEEALRGAAFMITGGWPVLSIPKDFRNILNAPSAIGGIRNFVFVMLVAAVIYSFILHRTKAGTYIYAIGANEEAAKLSGVSTDWYKILAYLLCGIGAALAGMVMLARLGAGEPSAGSGYELDAIAAAAIGGTSMDGGKGTIWGTIVGAIMLSTLKVGLVVIGMDTFVQYVAIGSVIIFAAYFDTLQAGITKAISAAKKH